MELIPIWALILVCVIANVAVWYFIYALLSSAKRGDEKEKKAWFKSLQDKIDEKKDE